MTYDERDIEMLRARLQEEKANYMAADVYAQIRRGELMEARYALDNFFMRLGAQAQKSVKAVLLMPKKYQDGAYHSRFDKFEAEEKELKERFKCALDVFEAATADAATSKERWMRAAEDLTDAEERAGIIPPHSFDFDDEN